MNYYFFSYTWRTTNHERWDFASAICKGEHPLDYLQRLTDRENEESKKYGRTLRYEQVVLYFIEISKEFYDKHKEI